MTYPLDENYFYQLFHAGVLTSFQFREGRHMEWPLLKEQLLRLKVTPVHGISANISVRVQGLSLLEVNKRLTEAPSFGKNVCHSNACHDNVLLIQGFQFI